MRRLAMVLGVLTYFAATAVAQSVGQDEISIRKAALDTVWQTVSDYHYDSTFGGVDWRQIHDRYSELAAAAKDDDALIALLNKMLRELKLSHYAVFRAKDQARSGSPAMSEAAIGVGLRLLDNTPVITSIVPDFPAALAGLQPGYVIRSIDGVSVQQMLRDAEAAAKQRPNFDKRHKIHSMCGDIIRHCFGQSGDSVTITYEDGSGLCHTITLTMKKRGDGTEISEDLPPVYVDFKAERRASDIGYISFSAFFPPVDSLFLAAMRDMNTMRGLIIDIRGNPGGEHVIGETIASKLINQKTVFSVFRYRDSTVQVSVEPDPPVFSGPIVILIDVMNGSASERFSGCMQSIGRAKIIGERSPGSVGPSEVKRLPNGASFLYLKAQSLTPDGTVLEGHGVIPDFTVSLDRKLLLKGVDSQIERAIAYLKTKMD
jgi:carboxyl-terminal processing protease